MAVRAGLCAVAVLTSCSPGAHTAVPGVIGAAGGGGTIQSAGVTFAFSFPKPTGIAKRATGGRTPAYLSSSTKSVTVQVTDTKNAGTNADIYANVPAALKVVQSANFANLTGNPNIAGQCGSDPSNAGNYKCLAKYQMPIGINTVTIASWDTNGGTGNKLSQRISNFTVAQGAANAFSVSLDANANAMSISASVGYCAGSVTVTNGQAIPTVGTSPVNFTTAYTDADGKTIVAPGLPSLQIQGNDAAYHSTTGTINGTGGTVAFSITQSTQTFTLTASSSSVTGATVNVKAVPPSSDGLAYSQTLSFTFSSGPAPPPSFLAIIEEAVGSSQGSIEFYTFNPATDLFGTASPASLASTIPAGSPQNDPDVDFPLDMVWDGNGDLLIANGGGLGTNPDHGNFACVPAGSVTTGANAATVLNTGLDEPASIALMSDSSVALGNLPGAASPHVQDYVLSGTYAANTPRSISGFASEGVVGVLPIAVDGSNPAGTYVASITDGGPDNNGSNIVWDRPGTSTLDITNTSMADPFIAYDSFNKQIVAADGNTPAGAAATQAFIQYLNADTGAVVQSGTLDDDGCFQGGTTPYAGCPPQGSNTANGISDSLAGGAAASSSGYIAVLAAADIQNGQSIWIYDNISGSRKTIGGPIPFSALTTTSGAGPWTYGGSTQAPVVSAMRWVTGTQLMVSLRSQYQTSSQGIYVFDVSKPLARMCTCYDAYGTQFPNSIPQVAFLQLNSTAQMPYSFAYKP
jgi:hypothetical protein